MKKYRLVFCMVIMFHLFNNGDLMVSATTGDGSSTVKQDMIIELLDINMCLNKELTYEELVNLSSSDLSILRNAYYAKHGYSFRNEKYSEIFSKYDWYRPSYSSVEEHLTIQDKLNINMILKMEKQFHNLYTSLTNEELEIIGNWQYSVPWVGAGYGVLYTLKGDRTFEFSNSEMDGEKRLISMQGTWSLLSDSLYLLVEEKKVRVGGELVPAFGSIATDYQIEGGEFVHVVLEKPILIELEVDINPKTLEHDDICKGIIIDGEEFYSISLNRETN